MLRVGFDLFFPLKWTILEMTALGIKTLLSTNIGACISSYQFYSTESRNRGTELMDLGGGNVRAGQCWEERAFHGDLSTAGGQGPIAGIEEGGMNKEIASTQGLPYSLATYSSSLATYSSHHLLLRGGPLHNCRMNGFIFISPWIFFPRPLMVPPSHHHDLVKLVAPWWGTWSRFMASKILMGSYRPPGPTSLFENVIKIRHQGQAHGCVTCAEAQDPTFRRPLRLVLMLYCCRLQVFSFWTRDSTFSFYMAPYKLCFWSYLSHTDILVT